MLRHESRPLIACAPKLCGPVCCAAVVAEWHTGSSFFFSIMAHRKLDRSTPIRLPRSASLCVPKEEAKPKPHAVSFLFPQSGSRPRSTAYFLPLLLFLPPSRRKTRHARRSKARGSIREVQFRTHSRLTREAFRPAGDMAEEKGALQSAREWVVEHKLRAVGTTSLNFQILSSPPARLCRRSRGGMEMELMPLLVRLRLQGRCGSAASSAPSPTTGPGRA